VYASLSIVTTEASAVPNEDVSRDPDFRYFTGHSERSELSNQVEIVRSPVEFYNKTRRDLSYAL